MKVSRIFTLDVEIAQRLKGCDNQSEIVNRLLTEYFKFSSDEKKKSLTDETNSTPKNEEGTEKT